MPSALLVRWGRVSLVAAVVGLPLFASCTSSEDTEPFIPATEGARQPAGSGSLLSEDEACGRVRDAAAAAAARLRCDAPEPAECPAFVRPGGASGCYEYYENSVAACEKSYENAKSCGALAPCVVSAERNDALDTCQMATGAGGQGGAAGQGGSPASGGAPQAGAGPEPEPVAGAPAAGGQGGGAAVAGAGGA